jgi:hypothetical protein
MIAAAAAVAATSSHAQVTFSIDWHSPTVGTPDSASSTPITEGDILSAFGGTPALGPLPSPGTVISAGPTGLGLAAYTACLGHAGGTPCALEVDALSYGTDFGFLGATGTLTTGDFLFSTDEYATALAGPFNAPDLSTELPCGDASADVWVNGAPLPAGPLPPFAAPVGHTSVVDGDGLVSCSGALYAGLGLLEPNFPGFPNLGDNLDALDFGPIPAAGFPSTGVYFSLDEAFPDPLVVQPNSGSAGAHGFTGSDVLWSPTPGSGPLLWAPAPQLGLNLVGALDDLDALAIWENGSGAFEPSLTPYDWLSGGTDMVLFSVRRGSPVIGMPDSIFGVPIEPGDILTTPLPTSFGGVSPFPGIFVAAENLGLTTQRTFGMPGDDLNALDTFQLLQFPDCNGNGVPDSLDISSLTSTDVNSNGIPDECELIATPYCFCVTGAPCGNVFATAGCRNSTGSGALLTGSGTSSVFADNLVLTISGMPTFQFGVLFMGSTMVGPLPFGDGLRCAGGIVSRFPVKNSGASGSFSYGPGLIGGGAPILPLSTWNFQGWYRDPAGPCGSGFNTSNALSVVFTP